MSLEVRHLRYSYPKADEPIIRDISFDVPDGLVTVVIGANGVGKSTLIKSILGIFKAGGEAFFNGVNRRHIPHKELHRFVGYMTQENALLTSLSVLNVVLLGRLGSLNLRVQEEDIAKAVSILRLLHLENLLERPFYALSGGQRRMVDVAQTLVRDPGILVMDEPTANLDLVNELQVLELVRAYTHQKKVATLLTLHDLNMAARYGDQLVLLRDGVVFRTGTPAEVITEENIQKAYGVEVRVSLDENNVPMLHPIAPVKKTKYMF